MVDTHRQAALLKRQRQQLRGTMRNVMSHVNSATRAQKAKRIVSQLLGHALWRNASTILSYWPLPEEPDIGALHRYALQKRKRVALAHPLHPGEYRIMPSKKAFPQCGSSPLVIAAIMNTWVALPHKIMQRAMLLLIPGLAFDRRGYRLGRGSGWYDKLLGEVPPPAAPTVTVGICYTRQLLTMLPVGSQDQPMEWLCHERALVSSLD